MCDSSDRWKEPVRAPVLHEFGPPPSTSAEVADSATVGFGVSDENGPIRGQSTLVRTLTEG